MGTKGERNIEIKTLPFESLLRTVVGVFLSTGGMETIGRKGGAPLGCRLWKTLLLLLLWKGTKWKCEQKLVASFTYCYFIVLDWKTEFPARYYLSRYFICGVILEMRHYRQN